MDRTLLFTRFARDSGADAPASAPDAATRSPFVAEADAVLARLQKVYDVLDECSGWYCDASGHAVFTVDEHRKRAPTDADRDTVDELLAESLGAAEEDAMTKLVVSAKALRQAEGEVYGEGLLETTTASSSAVSEKDLFEAHVLLHVRESVRQARERSNKLRVSRTKRLLAGREKLCPVVEYMPTNSQVLGSMSMEAQDVLAGIDESERREMELENQQLVHHLTSELEEARRIERQTMEISQLLATISDKVMDQHATLASLKGDAMDNADILAKVPETLQQAQERTAGYRYAMASFLVISALLLLLLDWLDT